MDQHQSSLATASSDTGQTTIRASVLNEQVIEVAPGWMASLEQALPHARYRAIALYDARGEVLHCTSTDFGIEFRQALNDALDAFVLGAARESRFLRGEGSRTAVMLALRDLHSALDDVPGVGPRRRRTLLRKFGSLAGVRRATREELAATVGRKVADAVLAFFAGQP